MKLWNPTRRRLTPTWAAGARRRVVHPKDFDPWPFTVTPVVLCARDDCVWIEANNNIYALNGMAEAQLPAHGVVALSLYPIWRLDPEWERVVGKLDHIDRKKVYPTRIDIGPLIRAGLAL